jgi:hypothetical protein
MTEEEQQRQFEEAIINMAVVEHHRYCMTFKRAKSEKDADMFYTALKIGVQQGINYATKQFLDYNKKLEEEQDGRSD